MSLDQVLVQLYNKFDQRGHHDYLVNRIFSFRINEIDFYLPQICYLVIKKKSAPLERLLLKMCQEDTSMFIKINWLFESFGEANKDNQKNYSKVETLLKHFQNQMFEGKNLSNNKMKLIVNNSIQSFSKIKKNNLQYRMEYLEFIRKFIKFITNFSLDLKKTKDKERKEKLKRYLQMYNQFLKYIKQQQRKQSLIGLSRGLYHGMLMPFSNLQSKPYESNMIVNFVIDEGACFETRKRVPYLIYLETVDLKEFNQRSFYDPCYTEPLTEDDQKSISLLNELEGMEFVILNDPNELNNDDSHQTQIQRYFSEFIEQKNKRRQNNLNQKSANLINHSFLENTELNLLQQENKEQQNYKNRMSNESSLQHNSNENIGDQDETSFNHLNHSQNILEKVNEEDELVEFDINKLKKIEEGMEKDNEECRFLQNNLYEQKLQKIREKSPYKYFNSYELRPLIIKGADDLRQEVIMMQLITKMKQILIHEDIKCYIQDYEIIVTGSDSGVLEFVKNSMSIDSLKKKHKKQATLKQIFKNEFPHNFEEAQQQFLISLAGASLMCYILQIKDRHNGNILIDNKGRCIHIDFGFVLGLSPGGVNFEKAPFKLTKEYVELLGGIDSDIFNLFKINLYYGFLALRKYVDSFVFLLKIIMEDSDLQCFKLFDLEKFRARFLEDKDEKYIHDYIEKLIDTSYDNWRTTKYDQFQKITNGILP